MLLVFICYNPRHGDMLYMEVSQTRRATVASDTANSSSYSSETGLASLVPDVVEDEVDRLLREEDGKIYRNRNDQL